MKANKNFRVSYSFYSKFGLPQDRIFEMLPPQLISNMGSVNCSKFYIHKGFSVQKLRLSLSLVFGLLLVFTSTGCMLFQPGASSKDSNLLPQGTGSSYTVLLKGSKPLTQEITEGMTVQSVIENTGAQRKFGKMEVVIKRQLPGKQVRHRLNVDYDPKKKRVPYDQDYTIHPNDIVLIAPDTTTQLDKVVDALSGVFGK